MKLKSVLLLAGLAGLLLGGATLASRSRADDAVTTYWANGRMQARTEYRDGRPEGQGQRWYPDGSLQAEGRYEAGRMEGAWRFWRADGTVDDERTGTYRAGERE